MSFPRRRPAEITFKIIKFIRDQPETKKTDLIYIVGNEVQYKSYIEDTLIKDGYITEKKEDRRYFYQITDKGEELFQLLKKDYLMKMFLKISGKRLRND